MTLFETRAKIRVCVISTKIFILGSRPYGRKSMWYNVKLKINCNSGYLKLFYSNKTN